MIYTIKSAVNAMCYCHIYDFILFTCCTLDKSQFVSSSTLLMALGFLLSKLVMMPQLLIYNRD